MFNTPWTRRVLPSGKSGWTARFGRLFLDVDAAIAVANLDNCNRFPSQTCPENPTASPIAHEYETDKDLFFADFSSAFKKLTELGRTNADQPDPPRPPPTCPKPLDCVLLPNGNVLRDGASLSDPTRCATFFCNAGELEVLRHECKELNCPPGQVPFTPAGQCCQRCRNEGLFIPLPPNGCDLPNGDFLKEGAIATDPDDSCTQFLCVGGRVRTLTRECKLCTIDCLPGFELVQKPGQCCPSCQALPSTSECEGKKEGDKCKLERCPNGLPSVGSSCKDWQEEQQQRQTSTCVRQGKELICLATEESSDPVPLMEPLSTDTTQACATRSEALMLNQCTEGENKALSGARHAGSGTGMALLAALIAMLAA